MVKSLPGERLFLVLLLALSVTINVGLTIKIKEYSRVDPPTQLEVGSRVGPLQATDLEGQPVTIEYQSADKPTILYAMSISCPACARNVNNVRALAEQTAGRYRLIALASEPEGMAEYVRREKLSFPILIATDATAREYKLRTIPAMMVIDGSGQVTHTWIGALFSTSQRSVESALGVTLPGLIPASEISQSPK